MNTPQSDEIYRILMKELSVTRKTVGLAQERVDAINAHREDIDAMIMKTTESYNFDRIQTVERNVLRMALYEICYDEEIPPKVAIAEAIRLVRKFSHPAASSFINAILDAIYKEHTGQEVDKKSFNESVNEMIADVEKLTVNLPVNIENIEKETYDDKDSEDVISDQ